MYERLMGLLRKKLMTGKMRARQLANSLWALAKLNHEDDEDVMALIRCMEAVRYLFPESQSLLFAIPSCICHSAVILAETRLPK